MNESKILFETDYYAWLEHSAKKTKNLGLVEVSEHLEEMTRAERNALGSQLARLITHLLKWKYQPDNQTRSWRTSIVNARGNIQRSLRTSPSLKSHVYQIAQSEYRHALNWFESETGIEKEELPTELEFSLDELLNDEFFPK